MGNSDIDNAKRRAQVAAEKLRKSIGIADAETTGLVLGTGWGDVLDIKHSAEVAFESILGFDELDMLPGHARQVVCGELDGRQVVALKGRVHVNERPSDPQLYRMVRLQIQMLLELGIKNLILTCAVGSLKPEFRVGDICVFDGLVTLFAPDMPLYAGEFCSPEDALVEEFRKIAVMESGDLVVKPGGHAMVRGPFFEGRRYDKAIAASVGASVIGMSVLPELCVASLYPGVKAIGLGFVTNSSFEVHSHDENVARAKRASAQLGGYLSRIVSRISGK